jgi:disulfide bond formation protein DsbB
MKMSTATKKSRSLDFSIEPRAWFMVGLVVCVGLLLAAAYFQFAGGLEPCPLCVTQRLFVMGVGFVLLAAVLHNPGKAGIRAYAISGFLLAAAGAFVSARHVWLQHLPPDQVPACGPGLSYMFQHFPVGDTLRAMLSGTGDCAKVDWTLLGFSMPAWVLIAFLALGVLSLAQVWNTKNTA